MAARQEYLLESTVRLELEKMKQNKALLRIFTVGKAGVDKSSLIRDLVGPTAEQKPPVAAGWNACMHKLEIERVQYTSGRRHVCSCIRHARNV